MTKEERQDVVEQILSLSYSQEDALKVINPMNDEQLQAMLRGLEIQRDNALLEANFC